MENDSIAQDLEVCCGNESYTEEEIKRLGWLVGQLMHRFKVPANRVVRHHDASKKACPRYYVTNPNAWQALHKRITSTVFEEDDMRPNEVWEYKWSGDSTNKNNYDKMHDVYKEITRHDDVVGDKTSGSIYDRVCWIDYRVRELVTMENAQAAAIEALTKAIGANPEDVAGIVEKAVKEKLESLNFKLKAQ